MTQPNDMGEQTWTDLLARGSREGFGPALLDLLREAEDRGIERAARRLAELEQRSAEYGGAWYALHVAAVEVRDLKGGRR